jgi:Ca-activated chloride channel homolog
MRWRRSVPISVLVVGLVFASLRAEAVESEGDHNLSPYFFIKSENSDVDRLPLKSTSVTADIAGVIADVMVAQVYKNEGERPIEAVYIFPASTRAAVHGMKMVIGERTITARIEKREEARRQYVEAREQGKSASLLEQHRPNVFQMNVANVLPGEEIRVELRYTELLVPTKGIYEFLYPTVVGPRYVSPSGDREKPGAGWTRNPYLHEGEPPTYAFHMKVNVSAGLPIQEVSCSSHKVQVNYQGESLSRVTLDPAEKFGGNRDFVLKYRLAGGSIQSGLLLFEGEEENFFLLMAHPPKRFTEREIPPREYLFIVDISGSMHGFPLEVSKKLLRDLIGGLRPEDRFNVLLFAGDSSVLAERSLPANGENIRKAIDLIDRQRGGGGTELLPALKRALAMSTEEGFSRTLILATDGYVSVEEEAFDLIRTQLGKANVFTFGIGASVNRHLIEGLARAGMGEPFVVTQPQEALSAASRFRELIQSPLLTGIKTDFQGFEVYDVEPPETPDLLADRPMILFGKWRGEPRGTIMIQGRTGRGPFEEAIQVAEAKPAAANQALRYLWARHRISVLADYNALRPRDERIREVTRLGLAYNLLTAYTSFVAVDTLVRMEHGRPVLVHQPLPLPQGVSDYAVAARGQGMLSAVPAMPHVRTRDSSDGRELFAEKKPQREEVIMESPKGKDLTLKIKEIFVPKGLDGSAVRSLLEKKMTEVLGCCSPCSQGPPLEVAVVLSIDSRGRMKDVKAEGGSPLEKTLEKCLREVLMGGARFPVNEGGEHGVIRIVLVLS